MILDNLAQRKETHMRKILLLGLAFTMSASVGIICAALNNDFSEYLKESPTIAMFMGFDTDEICRSFQDSPPSGLTASYDHDLPDVVCSEIKVDRENVSGLQVIEFWGSSFLGPIESDTDSISLVLNPNHFYMFMVHYDDDVIPYSTFA